MAGKGSFLLISALFHFLSFFIFGFSYYFPLYAQEDNDDSQLAQIVSSDSANLMESSRERERGVKMEEKASVDSSSEPNTFPVTSVKESGKKSSSELFNSVFPPASKVEGKDFSCCDIFGPYRKQESLFHHACTTDKNAIAGEILQGVSDKDNKFVDQPVCQNEEADTCNLSSSLYYGGQDLCSLCVPNTNTYISTDNYKKEVKDKSGCSTGEWWEGSLFY